MKKIPLYIWAISLFIVLHSCKEDDLVTIQDFNSDTKVELITTKTNVEISAENTSNLITQFTWSIPDFSLSEYSLAANSMTLGLQFSLDSDFTKFAEESVNGASFSYTGGTLNSIVNKLNFTEGVSSLFHIRLAVYAGKNTEPVYSNVVEVSILPYSIDYSTLYMSTDGSSSNSFATLYSQTENGEYTGFVNTPSAWYNFFFISVDGTVYGNTGVDNTEFHITDDETTYWNCWFPETSGCHYVTMSTNGMDWSASYIPEIAVMGDVSETLEFSSSNNTWNGEITTNTPNVNIYLSCTTSKYDKNGGTATPSDYTFYLLGDAAGDSGTLSFTETVDAKFITIAEAGKHTLSVDLNDPKNLTYKVSAPAPDKPVEKPANLYLHDKADNATYHSELHERTENIFECFYNAAAWEGFYLTSNTSLSAGKIYGYAPNGNQYNITNLPAEDFTTDDLWAFWFDSGVETYYYMQVDFSKNTWAPQTINGFYVTGEYNNWSTNSSPLAYNSATKTWSATIEVTNTTYGLQVLADIDGATNIWDNAIGTVSAEDNGSGELDWSSRSGTNNIPVSETGTYLITVDLSNSAQYKYTLEKQ